MKNYEFQTRDYFVGQYGYAVVANDGEVQTAT